MRLLKLFFIIGICISLLLTVTPASAAAITVDTTSDGLLVPGCTLREAIANANNDNNGGIVPNGCAAGSGADTININLPPGTVLTLAAGLLSDLDITSPITINGNGTIIEADSSLLGVIGVRVFDVSGSLTLNNITIRNGGSLTSLLTEGGCILVTGSLSLSSTTIQNCRALQGGAIYGFGASINIPAGNTITGNYAGSNGGGIFASGGTLSVGGTVTNNFAGLLAASTGGGIAYIGTGLTINGATITGNTAGNLTLLNAGGGIYVNGGGMISGANISNNTVYGTLDVVGASGGGGIFKDGLGSLTVSSTILNNNRVGGVVNLAGDGGGVYRANGSMSITGSRIEHNRLPSGVLTNGGAYYSLNVFGSDSITNSCIVDNSDRAVVNDFVGGSMNATDNWWGSSWGPNIPIAGPGTGSSVSSGDSIIGDGTSSGIVNVDDNANGMNYGTYSTAPSGGNWKTTAPSGCATCTTVSSNGEGRACA